MRTATARTSMLAVLETDEAMGHVNLALSEAAQGASRTAGVLRGVLKHRMTDGEAADVAVDLAYNLPRKIYGLGPHPSPRPTSSPSPEPE